MDLNNGLLWDDTTRHRTAYLASDPNHRQKIREQWRADGARCERDARVQREHGREHLAKPLENSSNTYYELLLWANKQEKQADMFEGGASNG